MTDYFVNPAAADDTGNGTSRATAKKYIASAITLCGASGDIVNLMDGDYTGDTQNSATWSISLPDGKSITIQKDSEATGTINLITGNAQYAVYNAAATGLTVLKNITITPKKRILYHIQDKEHSVTFDNCICLQGTVTPAPMFECAPDVNAAPTRTLTLLNCTALNPGQRIVYANGGSVYIDGGTYSASRLIDLYNADYSVLSIKNVTATVSTMVLRASALIGQATSIGRITIKDNTFDGDITIYAFAIGDTTVGYLETIGNTMDFTCASGSCGALLYGKDTVTPINATGVTIIRDNTITVGGASPGHIMLIGFGCDSANISNNRCFGGNWGIVYKSVGGSIYGNLVVGDYPIAIYQGGGNSVWNNTCVDIATRADAPGHEPGGAIILGNQDTYTVRNHIWNNIFVSTEKYAISDDSDKTTPRSHYVDYNCYYRTDSGDLAYLGGAARADGTAIKAYWAASGEYTLNDANSLFENPMLDADYRPRNRKVAGMFIGAVNPSEYTLGYFHHWPY